MGEAPPFATDLLCGRHWIDEYSCVRQRLRGMSFAATYSLEQFPFVIPASLKQKLVTHLPRFLCNSGQASDPGFTHQVRSLETLIWKREMIGEDKRVGNFTFS